MRITLLRCFGFVHQEDKEQYRHILTCVSAPHQEEDDSEDRDTDARLVLAVAVGASVFLCTLRRIQYMICKPLQADASDGSLLHFVAPLVSPELSRRSRHGRFSTVEQVFIPWSSAEQCVSQGGILL